MALKSTRIYGIMGTNFLGKMARPRHIIGWVTPPEWMGQEMIKSQPQGLKDYVF